MNNQIRLMGLFVVGMLLLWGSAAASAQEFPGPTIADISVYGEVIIEGTTSIPVDTAYFERSTDNGVSWVQSGPYMISSGKFYYDEVQSSCNSQPYLYRARLYNFYYDVYSDYSNTITAGVPCVDHLAEQVCTFTPLAVNGHFDVVRISGNGNRAFAQAEVGNYPYDMSSGDIKIWDISTNSLITTLSATREFDTSDDGTRVFGVSDISGGGQEIYFWNNGTGSQITSSTNYPTNYNFLSTSGDGTKLAFILDNGYSGLGKLYLWEEGVGIQEVVSTNSVQVAALSDDGSSLIFSSTANLTGANAAQNLVLYRWDTSTGTTTMIGRPSGIGSSDMIDFITVDGDASHIALRYLVLDAVTHEPDYLIYSWTASGGFTQLVDTRSASGSYNFLPEPMMAGWSADGQRLLLLTPTDLTGENPDGFANAPYPNSEYFFQDKGVMHQLSINFGPMFHPFMLNTISDDGSRILAYIQSPQPATYNDPSPTTVLAVGDCAVNHLYAPRNLSISNPTDMSIDLNWTDNAGDEDAYIIETSGDSGTTWQFVSAVPANSTSYTDNYAYCENGRQYRVLAYRDIDTQYSSPSSVATVICPVYPPTGLYIQTQDTEWVELIWNDMSSDETEFRLERSIDAGISWTEIAVIPADSTSYNTRGYCGADVAYRLRAYRASNHTFSPYSDLVTAQRLDCATPLSETVCTFTIVDNPAIVPSALTISGNGQRGFIRQNTQNAPAQDLYPEDLEIWDLNSTTLIDTIPDIGNFVVSDDGTRIAFNSRNNFTGANSDNELELFLWNNGVITQLSSSTDSGEYYSLSMNNAGSRLVFLNSNDNRAYLWQEGTGIQAIMPEATYVGVVAISGNGAKVALVALNNIFGDDPGNRGVLYLWDESTAYTRIADATDVGDGTQSLFAEFLYLDDDASHLSFRYNLFGAGTYQTEIYTWNATDGLVAVLNNPANSFVNEDYADDLPIAWSADGQRLYFTSVQDLTGENPDGLDMPLQTGEFFFLDNGQIRQLTTSIYLNRQPIVSGISNDGTRILAYTRMPQPFNPANFASAESYVVLGNCEFLPLLAPTSLSSSNPTTTSINLSWADNAEGETEYRLERSTDGITWTEISQPAANATSYSDTDLTCNTSYQYRVRAYRSADTSYSSYSNVATGTTGACPPNAPTSLSVTSSNPININLSWTDNAINETAYRVERSLNGGGTWSEIASLAANSTTYADAATCGAILYRVRAEKLGIYSAYSNTVTATSFTCATQLATQVCNFSPIFSIEDNPNWDVNVVKISGDGSLAFVRLNEHRDEYLYQAPEPITIWDIDSATQIGFIPDYTQSFDVSYDGTRVVYVSGTDGLVYLWDAGTVSAITASPVDFTYSWVSIDGEGTKIVITSRIWEEGTVRYPLYLWEEATGIQEILPDLTQNNAVEISKDGNTIVFTSAANLTGEDPSHLGMLYRWNTVAGLSSIGRPDNLDSEELNVDLISLDKNASHIAFRNFDAAGAAALYTWTETDGFVDLLNLRLSPYTMVYSDISLGGWTENGQRLMLLAPFNLTGENPDGTETLPYGVTPEYFFWEDGEFRQVTSTTNLFGHPHMFSISDDGSRILAFTAFPPQTSSEAYNNAEIYLAVGDCELLPLLAPTNLSGSTPSATSIDLTWTDNAVDETQYRLERSSDGGTTWTEIAQPAANATSYSNTGLSCGTAYDYRLRAYRSADTSYSSYSNIATGTTSACPLVAPTGLNLSATTQTSIDLIWTDNASDETEYRLERSTDGITWTEISQPAANATSYSDTGLTCNTSYQYRLRAYRSGDNSYSAYSSILIVQSQSCDGIVNVTCILQQFSAANDISEQAELFYFSGDGSRLAITYAGNGTNPEGLNLYDVATGNLLVNIPNAGYGDIDYDGNTFVFISSANYTGQNADASQEIFLWSNGGFTQLTNVTTPTNFTMVKISDDASTVVFVADGQVLGESAGTQYVYIWDAVNGIRKLINVDGAVGEVAISGDGSSVAFLHSADLNGYQVTGSFGLYIWDAVDGIDLIYGGFDYSNFLIYTLSMNADGSRLTFSAGINPLGLNPDGSLEVFLWDATTGLQQLSDVNELDNAYSFAIDASGQRLLSAIVTDPSNSHPQGSGYYLYDEDNGYSQVYFTTANGSTYWPAIFGTTLSSDGSKMALRIPVGWDGGINVNPYLKVFIATCTPPPLPPNAPTGLNITGISQIGISLSWTDNASDETEYRLERSTDGIAWTEVAQPAANSTVYTDTGLSCNTVYDYRIRAYRSDSNQYSSYSNVVEGTTALCPVSAPTGLLVTGTGQTNIALTWTDNAGDETGYRVERSANNGTSWAEIATPAANATSYNDTSAACNTSYDYRVRAYRSGDNQYSAYSNVVSDTTDVCIVLNAPTNIQQTANSQTGMSLSWTDNSSNESGYEIERSLDGTSWTLLSSLPADSTIYSDSGLNCATTYYYRIRSNHLGTGTYSTYGNSGALATAACPALVASVLSSTGSTANSISLSWTVDSSATSFTLAYYNGTGWVNLGIFPASTTTYTHSSLICGRSTQYQVTSFRSVDSASIISDAFSSSTSACPPLAAPNAPVVLNTEPALVSLQIPAKPATATSMSLERSSDGSTWTSLGNVTGSNYMDTTVVCGSSYQYRLLALRSSDGITSTSPVAVALTDACPIPTVLGTYRAGLWTFVASNNTAMPVNSFNFGDSSWQALVGDWDGDGVDGVGLYRNGEFALKNTASADAPENRFNFGNAEAGWQALVGDWDGNGTDTVGLYKDGLFLISNDNVNIQYRFNFGNGQAGWQAIAGDWNGDGQDGIGLYQNGYWALADNVSNPDGSRQNINYGPSQAGWLAIVGDWNGDGYDSIGLYKEGIWRMRTNSVNDVSESSLNFGQTADVPLAIFEN